MFPLEDIVTNFWCASSGTGNYVNMTFSQPVVLEGILSSGATSNNNRVRHYVSDFAIFYSNTVDGPLRLYSAQCEVSIEYNMLFETACSLYTIFNVL